MWYFKFITNFITNNFLPSPSHGVGIRLPSLILVASPHRVCPRGGFLMPPLLLLALGTGVGGMDAPSMSVAIPGGVKDG